MQLMRIQKINMSLTEKNLREKDFHNELQSRPKGRFENVFYKALANVWTDFYDCLKIKTRNQRKGETVYREQITNSTDLES